MRILCAVRGGPESKKTIEYAVSFAEKERARLVFLYVVSLDLFASSSDIRAGTIAKELSRMGEFILLMAQAKAAAEGVAADTFVRQGNIPEQILIACEEMSVETLILGRPENGNGESFFDAKKQENFAKTLKEEAGIKVVLV
ncbi:MAG: universal stress protein [Anaerolineae bacterium]|jgi:nucleotide-binding universal stress UspA family protein|nr:universal stress protein [Anaerolineae bacterium]MBT7073699.1 universal stress protein [Anaerolineae bacterium]MBT7781407.1 universal stress protein [Anaerolineae bacterium]